MIPTDPASFEAVVREGVLVPNGMPRFEEFDQAKMDGIRQYLRGEADRLRQSPGKGAAKP